MTREVMTVNNDIFTNFCLSLQLNYEHLLIVFDPNQRVQYNIIFRNDCTDDYDKTSNEKDF